MNVPASVGVPLMVIVLFAQDAVTPVGSPVAVPISETPEVVCVILVSGELVHNIGVLDATLAPFTVIVPVALALPQPPVSGIE